MSVEHEVVQDLMEQARAVRKEAAEQAAGLERLAREALADIRAREEKDFVQTQFAGCTTVYTYRVNPGPPVEIGDYLRVFSPMSNRHEYVRVVALGRGAWARRNGATKIAQRIRRPKLAKCEQSGNAD